MMLSVMPMPLIPELIRELKRLSPVLGIHQEEYSKHIGMMGVGSVVVELDAWIGGQYTTNQQVIMRGKIVANMVTLIKRQIGT
jgi:hypothetical protein